MTIFNRKKGGLMDNWVILTAISTAVIAVFAVTNFFLARRIKIKNDESRMIFNELLRALIASNLVQRSKGQQGIITTFKSLNNHLSETGVWKD
jgi:hypothetical protein